MKSLKRSKNIRESSSHENPNFVISSEEYETIPYQLVSRDQPCLLANESHKSDRKVEPNIIRSDSLEDPITSTPVIYVEEDAHFPMSAAWPLEYGSQTSQQRCHCQCICGSTTGFKIKDSPTTSEENKYNDSSWRLLHMSRAKLKGSTSTSRLIAGFAVITMVNMNIHSPTKVPEWLFVVFTVTNTSLVSVHIFALMISTYVIPNIDAIFKIRHEEMSTEQPHESLRRFIDLAWTFSTVLGLFLFLFQMLIVCWIQLLDFSFTASLVGSLLVAPAMVIFVAVVIHFYKHLSAYEVAHEV